MLIIRPICVDYIRQGIKVRILGGESGLYIQRLFFPVGIRSGMKKALHRRAF